MADIDVREEQELWDEWLDDRRTIEVIARLKKLESDILYSLGHLIDKDERSRNIDCANGIAMSVDLILSYGKGK